MLIKRLTRQALFMGLSGLVVSSVLLSACGGATESVAEATTPSAAAETTLPETQATEPLAATETTPSETQPTAPPTVEESQEEESLSMPVDQVACLPVEIPENTLVQAASADDWATGPEDAPITVIEYGDFQ